MTMMKMLRPAFSAMSFCLLASAAAAQEDRTPDEALDMDDECRSGGTGACALDALQRRGLSKSASASSASDSRPQVDEECFQVDTYYRQWDNKIRMLGTRKSHEKSQELCQERCQQTDECAHFSYWPDGGCLLVNRFSFPVHHKGVIGGPRSCKKYFASGIKPPEVQKIAPDSAWVAATSSYTPPKRSYLLSSRKGRFGTPDLTNCHTATRQDQGTCYEDVDWAMHQGIFEKPSDYPELSAGASSFEEFQADLHIKEPKRCPQPCLLKYADYSVPSYREPGYPIMKGVSYGASPLKTMKSHLRNDDFMAELPGAMWADWGRGDMQLIKDMGANTMRMYGNDANTSHRTFLDTAMSKGIGIIAGMSDFGFIQGPDNCLLHEYYCYDEAYFYFHKNLLLGFTIDNFKKYHPALKALILANEPDLKVHPRNLICRAMASIFDAILDAEKDVGITGNPIALTITWSFANFHGPKGTPALGQMEDFWKCLQEGPEKAPTNYKPKNDLVKAFRQRFVNSFNTANTHKEVKDMFLDRYAKSSFWTDDLKIPVFIGEYHSVRHGMKDDLTQMVAYAKSKEFPFFMGYNFFEFSRRYDKGGPEMDFGMFGYGDCVLSDMNYTGQVYTIWNLVPMNDNKGYPLAKALKAAYGTGRELPSLSHSHLECQLGTMGVP